MNMTTEYAHMMLNLGLILILVLVLVFALKKIRFSKLAKNQQIAIINTVPIGSKERVLLIEVNDKTLLIGVTPNHISTLHVFDKMDATKPAADEYLDEMKSFSETLANQKNLIDG